ncbi:hypothetical protein [Delftia tsuruhatensis]|uniref:hypothetical protein n=1 Tax=Delftia tsuruhatensis TaxID=180282 RepID=UPI002AD4A586|nr:hypothetical protein [Delftia tsuruhatensis]WQM81738.1 hypothetical protein RNT40_23970 [Delftia tsuruhatensis]
MSTLEIKVGRTYRGKRPGNSQGLVNDRTVKWICRLDQVVQYDGPAVRIGAHFPKVKIADFLKWAERDVTDELPAGEYAAWPVPPIAAQAAAKEASDA